MSCFSNHQLLILASQLNAGVQARLQDLGFSEVRCFPVAAFLLMHLNQGPARTKVTHMLLISA